MIANVVLVSGIEHSDSVTHIHTFNLFQILFLYRFKILIPLIKAFIVVFNV